MDEKPLVAQSDSLVTSATNSTQAVQAPIRLDLWNKAKEWYNRFNAIERAEGGRNFMTMREAYLDMVWADEQEQRIFSQEAD